MKGKRKRISSWLWSTSSFFSSIPIGFKVIFYSFSAYIHSLWLTPQYLLNKAQILCFIVENAVGVLPRPAPPANFVISEQGNLASPLPSERINPTVSCENRTVFTESLSIIWPDPTMCLPPWSHTLDIHSYTYSLKFYLYKL